MSLHLYCEHCDLMRRLNATYVAEPVPSEMAKPGGQGLRAEVFSLMEGPGSSGDFQGDF